MQRRLRSEKEHSSLLDRCAIHGCMVRSLGFRSIADALLCHSHYYYYTFNDQGRQLRPGPSDGIWQSSSRIMFIRSHSRSMS